jgi:histidinol-phosphatase (PHP family)
MIPLDYHLHSRFSVDGHYSIDEMCDAALARGLRDICLTEHIDFDRQDAGYGFFDYGAYSAAVDEARARYAGRLVIRKGLEVDFRRAFGAEPGEVLATMAFDFVIGSVHTAARASTSVK